MKPKRCQMAMPCPTIPLALPFLSSALSKIPTASLSQMSRSTYGKRIPKVTTMCNIPIVKDQTDGASCAVMRRATFGSKLSSQYHTRFRMTAQSGNS